MKKNLTVEQRAGEIAAQRIRVLVESGVPTDKLAAVLVENARLLVVSGGVLPIHSGGGYEVRASDGSAYTINASGCTCAFYTKKISGGRCKHIVATELYAAGAAAIIEDYRAEAARLQREADALMP